MDPATGKWLASSANPRATMNWPATMISQDQNIAGPPRPMPTPKLPKDPVETLMKLNASAKFDEEPQRPAQLRLDAERLQVGIVLRRDLLLTGTRHDLLLLPPHLVVRD